MGIKQIAITVAVIVVIGAIIGIVQGNLDDWIEDVWDYFMELIDDLTNVRP